MMKKLLILAVCALIPVFSAAGEDFSHDLFTALLRDHVENGLVDYEELKDDSRLNEYLRLLARFDPEDLEDDKERMAFYINAYNAYTLKVIVDNYPLESITDLNKGGLGVSTILKRTIWDKRLVTIDRKKMTLNDVEHEILRKDFDDFRIHFALVCAALSCPPLRDEAFVGNRLDEQLDEQGRLFLQNRGLNSFDTENQVAYLTKILKWFGEDFGKNDTDRLLSLAPYLEQAAADEIRRNAKQWKIRFNEYDWSLNDLE